MFLTLSFLVLGACGGKAKLRVASKDTAEQEILGEIIAQLLEKKLDVDVERRLRLGETNIVNSAILTGDVDMYPEYSSVAYRVILKVDEAGDPQMSLDRLQSEYRSKMNAEWLAPLGFDAHWVMAVSSANEGVKKLNQLSDIANDARDWKVGMIRGFSERPDGYDNLKSIYKFTESGAGRMLELPLLFDALIKKQVDMAGVSSTEPRLLSSDYRVLADDKNAFPQNRPAIVVREEALAKNPNLASVLGALSGKISKDKMQSMNKDVELDKKSAASVAAAFLQSANLL